MMSVEPIVKSWTTSSGEHPTAACGKPIGANVSCYTPSVLTMAQSKDQDLVSLEKYDPGAHVAKVMSFSQKYGLSDAE